MSSISEFFIVPRIIDQFERKRWEKKRKDVNYKLFSKKFLLYMNSPLSKIRLTDGLFWLNL